MGFGFLEVGTVTPRPQPGNPQPSDVPIAEKQAIINRFGFNNVGVDEFLRNVARSRWKGVLGINIGKNADTPPERAVDDYAIGFEKVVRRGELRHGEHLLAQHEEPARPAAGRAAGRVCWQACLRCEEPLAR